jgi:hypothetical protein
VRRAGISPGISRTTHSSAPLLLSAVPARKGRAGTAFLWCVAAGPQADTEKVSYDGLVAEYRDATARMSLPTGSHLARASAPREARTPGTSAGLGTTATSRSIVEKHNHRSWQRRTECFATANTIWVNTTQGFHGIGGRGKRPLIRRIRFARAALIALLSVVGVRCRQPSSARRSRPSCAASPSSSRWWTLPMRPDPR